MEMATSEQLRQDALAILQALRQAGFLTGLVSDCTIETPTQWPNSSLARLLQATAFSCLLGVRKPDPAIYLHAVAQLGGAFKVFRFDRLLEFVFQSRLFLKRLHHQRSTPQPFTAVQVGAMYLAQQIGQRLSIGFETVAASQPAGLSESVIRQLADRTGQFRQPSVNLGRRFANHGGQKIGERERYVLKRI